ncbi:hypothetical protein HYALB_00011959 [Hymenoscyphus albidus]|uniref:Uncharacterized protein n=1 Tax=Hymenoscyphus albidus TaxID=595503 RepID=A0A9N9LQG6_9HELO|nr:hypothetical protein HYALB_00011959 [Hymenoscyphus albidus]
MHKEDSEYSGYGPRQLNNLNKHHFQTKLGLIAILEFSLMERAFSKTSFMFSRNQAPERLARGIWCLLASELKEPPEPVTVLGPH